MKKKNKAVWGTRFNNAPSKIFEAIGASIDVDKRLFAEDVLGSIIHTQMLIKQKIIDRKKGNKIISGLKKIRNEIEKNKFKLLSKKIDNFLIFKSSKNFFVFDVLGCSMFTARTSKFLKLLF